MELCEKYFVLRIFLSANAYLIKNDNNIHKFKFALYNQEKCSNKYYFRLKILLISVNDRFTHKNKTIN